MGRRTEERANFADQGDFFEEFLIMGGGLLRVSASVGWRGSEVAEMGSTGNADGWGWRPAVLSGGLPSPKIRTWGTQLCWSDLGHLPIVNYFGPDFILTAQVYGTLRSCQLS